MSDQVQVPLESGFIRFLSDGKPYLCCPISEASLASITELLGLKDFRQSDSITLGEFENSVFTVGRPK